MATTLLITPAAFAPAYNPIIFTFTSTTNTITGFRYLVDVYSGNTGNNLVARLKITPTQFGDGYVDLSKILQNFVSESALFTSGTDGNVAEAYYDYNVKLGEEYLSTWPYGKAVSAGTGTYSGYTVLSGTVAHTYIAGDQINVLTNPLGISAQINGLHSVLSASSTQVLLNLRFPITSSSTINVSGITQYADSRKVEFSAQTSLTGTRVFNGALDWPEWKAWSLLNYTLSYGTASTTKFLLTSLEPETSVTDTTRRFYMTPSQAIWLNFHTDTPNSAHTVSFEYVSSTGVVLSTGTYDIENADQGYIKQFKIGFSTVSIPSPQVGSYIRFRITRTTPSTILTRWYVIYADTRCRREDIQVYYQDRLGSILSQSFTLNSKQNIEVERTTIRKAVLYGANSQLDLSDSSSVITNIDLNRQYELATDWLTDANIELLEELVSSKYVWMLQGSNYIPVVVQDKGYETTYQRNKVLQRKNITVQIANQQPLN